MKFTEHEMKVMWDIVKRNLDKLRAMNAHLGPKRFRNKLKVTEEIWYRLQHKNEFKCFDFKPFEYRLLTGYLFDVSTKDSVHGEDYWANCKAQGKLYDMEERRKNLVYEE